MAKGTNQKLKLLYLMKILLEKTDEEHSITMQEIQESLECYGIKAERKSLYSDMESLRQYGMDIIGRQMERTYYYSVGNRQFELAELKLLVDSVQAAKFITVKKSNELIKKIESLASRYEAAKLQRQVYVAERDKKMELRKDGALYAVSPWALSWSDENYYLIAFDSLESKIKHFRVDKMLRIEMTGKKREGKQCFDEFDMAVYTRKMFGMFGGEEQTVKIECEKALAGVMIDRFGKDVTFIKKDNGYFTAIVKVAVSRQFFAWVMALGEGARITGPEPVVAQMREEADRLVRQYR